MIIQTVNSSEFNDAFCLMDRAKNFSYPGRHALYDYFYDMSEGIGKPYELDVIAICCEFSEYDAEEIIEQYGNKGDGAEDVIKDLHNKTIVLDVSPDRWIIGEF